jgi:hypothetical protein
LAYHPNFSSGLEPRPLGTAVNSFSLETRGLLLRCMGHQFSKIPAIRIAHIKMLHPLASSIIISQRRSNPLVSREKEFTAVPRGLGSRPLLKFG